MDEGRGRVRAAARGLPRPEDVLGLARQRFDAAAGRLSLALMANSRLHRQAFERLAWRVSERALVQHIAGQREALVRLSDQARRCLDRGLAARREALGNCSRLLDSVSYQSVLRRGFALVQDGAGHPVRSAAATFPGQGVGIEFHDGRVAATIGGGAPRRKPRGSGGEGQGTLL
jgi:exodeoxyribonuclease VII large subunit